MTSPEPLPGAVELPDAKPWWQSRAVIGALVVLVAQVARLVGVEIDSAELTDALLQLLEITGATVALWGRVRATRPVRFRSAKTVALPAADRAPEQLRDPLEPVPPDADTPARAARHPHDGVDAALGHFRSE